MIFGGVVKLGHHASTHGDSVTYQQRERPRDVVILDAALWHDRSACRSTSVALTWAVPHPLGVC